MIERRVMAKAADLGEGNVVRFLSFRSDDTAPVAASNLEPGVAADPSGLLEIVVNGVRSCPVRRAQSEFSHERSAPKIRQIIIGFFARRQRL